MPGESARGLERMVCAMFFVPHPDGAVTRYGELETTADLVAEATAAAKFAVRSPKGRYVRLEALDLANLEAQLVDGTVVRVVDRALVSRLRSSARAEGESITELHRVVHDVPLTRKESGGEAGRDDSGGDPAVSSEGGGEQASSAADGGATSGRERSTTLFLDTDALPAGVMSRLHTLNVVKKERGDSSESKGRAVMKESLWALLSDPESSKAASWVSIVMLSVILFSTVTMVMETMPRFYDEPDGFRLPWDLFETVSISIFTIELGLRFATAPDRAAFCTDSLNFVDLVAILPFYLELALQGVEVPGLAVLRVLRLARVLRLLTAFKDGLNVLSETFIDSLQALRMLVFFVCIGMIVFSSLMFYIERGVYDVDTGVWMIQNGYECDYECTRVRLPFCTEELYNATVSGAFASGQLERPRMVFVHNRHRGEDANCVRQWERSPYQSIPESFWWCLVTMTTVGYGDIYPVSALGKLFCMMTAVAGLLVIALPISIVGSNFDEAMLRQKRQKRLEKKRAAQARMMDIAKQKFTARFDRTLIKRLEEDAAAARAEVEDNHDEEEEDTTEHALEAEFEDMR